MITDEQEKLIINYGNAMVNAINSYSPIGKWIEPPQLKESGAALEAEFARLNARVAELEARDDGGKRNAVKPDIYMSEITSQAESIILRNHITDGFGSYWLKFCHCGAPMQVVRPGDARCSKECYRKDVPDANP